MPGTATDGTGVVETATPADAGSVVDVAPVTVAGTPMWLLLSDGGRVGRWHGRVRPLRATGGGLDTT